MAKKHETPAPGQIAETAEAPAAEAPAPETPAIDPAVAALPQKTRGEILSQGLTESDRQRIRDIRGKCRSMVEHVKGFLFLVDRMQEIGPLNEWADMACAEAIAAIEGQAIARELQRGSFTLKDEAE